MFVRYKIYIINIHYTYLQKCDIYSLVDFFASFPNVLDIDIAPLYFSIMIILLAIKRNNNRNKSCIKFLK